MPLDLPLRGAGSWNWRRNLILASLLLVIAVTAYIPVFRNPFVHFDDPLYITENPHVRGGVNWGTLKWALTTFDAGNWHPVTWIAHAVDFQMFGLAAGGHHFVSVLLHGINSCLLFVLLGRSTGQRWRSLFVAVLFAVHPLNVESVAWAAELKTVLCTLFFFLALGAYGWYSQKPGTNRFVLFFSLFAASLASKPMAITLPFVMLLLDFWPLGRIRDWSTLSSQIAVVQKPFTSLLLEKAPLFALCIASAVVTIAAQRTTGSVVPLSVAAAGAAVTSVAPISLALRLRNALISYGAYVWKAFLPFGLAPFYPYPFGSPPAWELPLAVAFILLISAGSWRARDKYPYFSAGWFWYLGTLVPVIGLVQVGAQAMADRYAYIPLVGIFVMVAWSVGDFAESRKLNPQMAFAPAAIILTILGCITWRQVRYWRSNFDLWSHTLEVAPNNPFAEHNISVDLMQGGKFQEALGHLQNDIRIDPGDVVSRINLAVALEHQERYSEAIREYGMALRQTSDPALLPIVYENMGNIYYVVGDFSKSEESYLDALRISPGRATAMTKLNKVRTDEQINAFANSVADHPTAGGYLRLGRMLSEADWIPQARYSYEKALQMDPSLQQARAALAALPAGSTE